MRRCPRCGEEVDTGYLHFCDPPDVGKSIFIKFDVLKILGWFTRKRKRRGKLSS